MWRFGVCDLGWLCYWALLSCFSDFWLCWDDGVYGDPGSVLDWVGSYSTFMCVNGLGDWFWSCHCSVFVCLGCGLWVQRAWFGLLLPLFCVCAFEMMRFGCSLSSKGLGLVCVFFLSFGLILVDLV